MQFYSKDEGGGLLLRNGTFNFEQEVNFIFENWIIYNQLQKMEDVINKTNTHT